MDHDRAGHVGPRGDHATSGDGVGVTNIGNYAFDGCIALTAIDVAPFNRAFSSVDGVLLNKSRTTLILCPEGKCGSFTIPNSVTEIRWNAFLCRCLTTVTIGSGVTNIMYTGLDSYGCPGLMAIHVDALSSTYRSVDGVLFDWRGTTLVRCPQGRSGNYTVPDGVNDVHELAFDSCAGLTNVTIPASVTRIDYKAFSYCAGLLGVCFRGNAPGLGQYVFDNAARATSYYLQGTTGWGPTFGGLPTAPWVLPNPLILMLSPDFGVGTNGYGFVISWATNASVVVEACPDLALPDWSPVGTNTPVEGWFYFSDPEWTNHPNRFYRLRSP